MRMTMKSFKVQAGEFKHIYDPSIGETERWYINDHCIIHDGEVWHMFGITHEEPANPLEEKIFAHATSQELSGPLWEKQPHVLSYSPAHGESHVWAPHAIKHEGLYYMYYCAGGADNAHYRIHLATSKDLYTWERSPANPLVVDGFDARDPMILRVGEEWVMYYTANSTPTGGNHLVACVTSKDLLYWGNKRVVFTHTQEGTYGGPCESPFVVYEHGHYFLFIGPCDSYNDTHVYVSDDPFSFSMDNEVGVIPSHAAEVIIDSAGKYYVTRAGWGEGGLFIAPLFFHLQ